MQRGESAGRWRQGDQTDTPQNRVRKEKVEKVIKVENGVGVADEKARKTSSRIGGVGGGGDGG